MFFVVPVLQASFKIKAGSDEFMLDGVFGKVGVGLHVQLSHQPCPVSTYCSNTQG